MAASRPCVQRTAFGAPVVPDVNNSSRRSEGSGSRTGAACTCGVVQTCRVGGRADAQEAPGAQPEVEAVEQGAADLVGDHGGAVREPDVAGELLAPAGGVDADDALRRRAPRRPARTGTRGRCRAGPRCAPGLRCPQGSRPAAPVAGSRRRPGSSSTSGPRSAARVPGRGRGRTRARSPWCARVPGRPARPVPGCSGLPALSPPEAPSHDRSVGVEGR